VIIYRELFPDLITCWRDYFHQPDLPFLYVQLAAYRSATSDNEVWPAMRAAQAEVEKSVSGTAMVVAIDGGLEDNIHPPFKQLVGERLAQAALATAYGRPGPVGGPRIESAEFKDDRVVLHFSRIGQGLEAKAAELGLGGKYKLDQGVLHGFSMAVSDGVFIPANARIDGDTVVVHNDKISEPVSVRYAWEDFPCANLYNASGFPAVPFSIDSADNLAVSQ
ncbi:MAG: sialate O-acetylesterase, partial [Verrucomicrobiota bacterium]|nr:sialate O-acetylesterase [Verrucomicrobiota bacterium]